MQTAPKRAKRRLIFLSGKQETATDEGGNEETFIE